MKKIKIDTVMVLVAFAIAAAIAVLLHGRFLGIDDAHIFFSYAENLASGRGITYSNNGVPVEGCTSMLWLVMCAINFYVGFNETGILVCAVALLLATQFIWLSIIDKLAVRASVSPATGKMIYATLMLSSVCYFSWMAASLMDCVLWGFVIAGMAYVLMNSFECSRMRVSVGVGVFAMAPWVRPEAMLVGSACIFLMLVWRISHRKKFFGVLLIAFAFCISLAALTVFRIWYFGYPLPNTYYAKVSPSMAYNIAEGLHYAFKYACSSIVVPLFGACAVAGIIFAIRRRAIVEDHLLWAWCVVACLPPVLAGGDHFQMFRFFQPAYPMVCALLSILLARLAAPVVQKYGIAAVTLVLLVVCLFLWNRPFSWLEEFSKEPACGKFLRNEVLLAEHEMEMGCKLARLFGSDVRPPNLGVFPAGGIARSYPGKVVDLLGLNNVEIAHFPGKRRGFKNHAAFEPAIFNRLGVEAMAFSPNCSEARQFLKGLCDSPDFASKFRFGRISRKAGSEHMDMMVSRQYLQLLFSTGKFDFQDLIEYKDGSWKDVAADSMSGKSVYN